MSDALPPATQGIISWEWVRFMIHPDVTNKPSPLTCSRCHERCECDHFRGGSGNLCPRCYRREASQDAPGSTISSPIPPVTPTQDPAANGQGEATK